MQYDPADEPSPLPHAPFKALTVPRPIGWLSTRSPEGVANLAPYSQWQHLSFDPPVIMFAASRRADGTPKDTVRNAETTGWFVWNMATWDLREAVVASAATFAPDVDEFERTGLRRVAAGLSDLPMVAASPAHYECRVIDVHRLPGRTPERAVDIVYGEVARLHLDDAVLTADGRVDIARIRPIARLGHYDYAVIEETFAMRVPRPEEVDPAGRAANARGGRD